MFRLFSSIILATTCNLFANPTLVHDDDLLNTKIYKLENGLTVYLSENKLNPNFYAEIAVRCGSVHDPKDATGIAHYLEHLMFKGTKKLGTSDFAKEEKILTRIAELFETHKKENDTEIRKQLYAEINKLSQQAAEFAITNEMDRLYNILGATNVNAHTSFDETVYKVALPSNRLEQWAMLESDRFKQPIFRLFHTELETVYEEKNRSNDNGNNLVFNALMKGVYPNFPYGNTILGAPKHLKSPSITQLYDHYAKYYSPDNMAIIISGDIDTGKTLQLIEKYFSKLERSDLKRETLSASITEFDNVKRIKVPFQGEELISMAYKTVPHTHEDSSALEMFDMLMDNSIVGLINLNLVQKQKVRNAGAWPFQLNHGGSQHFYAYPREGQTLEDLETLINSQIELVKEGKFDEALLDAIRSDLKKQEELSFESNEGRVASMRDAFINKHAWSHVVQRHSRYANVSKSDIIHVANKYFNNNYVVIHRVKGDANIEAVEKPQIDPIPVNTEELSDYATEIIEKEILAIAPSYIQEGKQYQLTKKENGVQFISVTNPVNNIFSIAWHFPEGKFTNGKLGVALEVLALSGTDTLSAEELKKQWYNLGVDMAYGNSETTSYIKLIGPEKSFEAATKLLYQWVDTFSFDQQVLENVVADIKVETQDLANNPGSIVHAMARYRRYGNNSIYHKALPFSKLDALSKKDIKQTIQSLFKQQHTVSYVGKKSPEAWQSAISINEKLTPAPTLAKRELVKEEEAVSIHFFHRDMAQAHIWIESLAGTYDASDEPASKVFNEYFSGGMSGVVFQELREARGLAYDASGFTSTPNRIGGDFVNVGRIGCQADKTIEALTTFIELFDKVPNEQNRFDEAKNSLTLRSTTNRVEFRDVAETLMYWQRRGIKGNLNQLVLKGIRTTELTDLQQFHSDHIKGKRKRVSIVGDRTKIDMEALKKLGPVTEVTKEMLFSM